MKLNQKELRRLRRALRSGATQIVKLRKETLQHGLADHWRWKQWVNHGPSAVRDLLVAAEIIDDLLKCGGHLSFVGSATMARHSTRRRKKRPQQQTPHLSLVTHNSIQVRPWHGQTKEATPL
jgi:hypothetical protein